MSNLELTHRIKHGLYWDKRISDNEIHVEARDDVVILFGCVDTKLKFLAAAEVARPLIGKRRLQNDIEVLMNISVTDQELESILVMRIRDHIPGELGFELKVKKGLVHIQGVVRSRTIKALIACLVWETSGVRDLINELKIQTSIHV